jgi:hypothetical protein
MNYKSHQIVLLDLKNLIKQLDSSALTKKTKPYLRQVLERILDTL